MQIETCVAKTQYKVLYKGNVKTAQTGSKSLKTHKNFKIHIAKQHLIEDLADM